MNRFACLICALWLMSTGVTAQPRGQEQSVSVNVERLAQEFPQFSLADIKLMTDYFMKLDKAGLQLEETTQRGMEVMARGKALLTEDERREMKRLGDKMRGTLTAEETTRVRALRAELQQGNSISEADHQFINSMMKESFLRLPPSSQNRLRELYGKALRAFLQTVQ